jgi:hypothetical protein
LLTFVENEKIDSSLFKPNTAATKHSQAMADSKPPQVSPSGESVRDEDLIARDPVAAVDALERKQKTFDASIEISEKASLLRPERKSDTKAPSRSDSVQVNVREPLSSSVNAALRTRAPAKPLENPPAASTPPPQAPRPPRCNLQLMSISLLSVFTIVMLLVAKMPSFSDGNATTDGSLDSNLVLSPLCDERMPIKTFMFSLSDRLLNDTHTVYIHTGRKAQVTQLLRRGQVVYIEMMADDQVAIFPTGDVNSCMLRTRDPTRDIRWLEDVACAHEPIAFSRMQTLVGPLPVSLPETMFDLPRVCHGDNGIVHDLTGSFAPVQTFMHSRPDSTVMISTILQLLQLEFGSAYIRVPTLPGRLIQSWNRFVDWQWNATLTQFAEGEAPLVVNRTRSACCMGFDPCEDTPLPSQPVCQDYATCIGRDSHPSCRGSWKEQRCHCDYALASALALPGKTQCGDCLDSEESCDCYVMAWMMQWTASSRPCWCSGICAKSLQSFLCSAKRICPGSPTSPRSCYLDLGWCVRDQELLCSKCHLPAPVNDDDGHC